MITFTLNGKQVQTKASRDAPLIDVLRQEFRLTGAKKGCGTGACGVCTVLLDSQAVNGCSLTVAQIEGHHVTTIEGLDDAISEMVKKALIQTDAPQCGFCTPAMVLRSWALLQRTVSPTRAQISLELSPTLCRCSGYSQYIDAVQLAAAKLSSSSGSPAPTDAAHFRILAWDGSEAIEADNEPVVSFSRSDIIGTSPARADGALIAGGQAKFTDDLVPDSGAAFLFGAGVFSPHPHARIESIDSEEAMAAAGVQCVLTAKDVPGKNNYGKVIRDREAICGDIVKVVGDCVALVVADTEAHARQAAAKVKVKYSLLPAEVPTVDSLTSQACGSESDSVFSTMIIEKGEPEKLFDAGEGVLVKGEFSTQRVDQCPLELACSIAFWDEENRLTVIAPTQHVFFDRLNIARVLGLKVSQVRVKQPYVGGAFGKREDIHTQILAALATFHTGKPVKVRFNRGESLAYTTKRHPFRISIETLVEPHSGKLLAQKVNMVADGGAYASWSPNVLRKAAVLSCGPYYLPHVRVDASVRRTNNPVSGAFRGFGAPQAAFAMERQMDMIAHTLGLDPLELRRINGLEKNHTTITGHSLDTPVPLKACLSALQREISKRVESGTTQSKENHNSLLTSWGMAAMMYGIGFGAGIHDIGQARITLNPDGSVEVDTGVVDYGQGASTVMQQIAAQIFEISPNAVSTSHADTHATVNSGSSVASRQTTVTGNAVMKAAGVLKERMLKAVSTHINSPLSALSIEHSCISTENGSQRFTYAQVYQIMKEQHLSVTATAEFALHRFTSRLDKSTGQGKAYWPYTYGCQAAHIAVHPTTGRVTVTEIIAVHYIGRALNPQRIQGQIYGAVAQGIGYALKERVPVVNGKVTIDTLNQYPIVRAPEMPPVKIILLEDGKGAGPFGAVGIGEPPIVPTAPAIANAVFNATGYDARKLPISAATLKKHLNKEKT